LDEGNLALMINFRYHVVSLVAVFLALAVGIVLGAGPLKEPIGSSLADQVGSLRDDKDALRAELEAASERGAYGDSTLLGVQAAALEGMLTGRTVAVVTVGSDLDPRLEALRSGIAAAGGVLAADVHLEDALVAGPDEPRAAAAEEVASLLNRSAREDLGDRAMVALGLATALKAEPEPDTAGESGAADGAAGGADDEKSAAPDKSSDPEKSPDQAGTGDGEAGGGTAVDRAALWEALVGAGLVSGSVTKGAEVAVVLAGPYLLDLAAVDAEVMTAAREEHCVPLVAAFVTAGLPTVVAGPDQVETDLVRRIVSDRTLREKLSTVVAPLPGAEAITALWAAAAELHGGHGPYGVDGGDAILPERQPAPRPDPEKDQDSKDGKVSGSPSPTAAVWGGLDGRGLRAPWLV
jgi:hypothetical protein